MQHIFMDRYSLLESPVHRLHPAIKVVAALILVLTIVLLQPTQWLLMLGIGIFLAIVISCSRIPWRFIAWRVFLLEPFVMGVAVLALFQPGGWQVFLVLIAKCTLCLLTMLLLSNTTPFSDLVRVLRNIRVPELMVTTLALMYRYLFVLVDESQRMSRARASRTFTDQRAWKWRSIVTVISQLFIRSSERAERIYLAMCARGWK